MLSLRTGCAFAVGCLILFGSDSGRGEPRAVIELFTSQSCSSCPPADRLLAEYARDPSVVALTLAVDYWDYLGWKDTLATHGHSMRQRAYAKARGDRHVYTPQAVISGAVHVLGSDKAAIEKTIPAVRERHGSMTLPVKLEQQGDKLSVALPAKESSAPAEVWLCATSRSVPVTIGRGENGGHTVTYSNVVRRWIKLGDWNGKAETYSIGAADVRSDVVDGVAVLVQRGGVATPKAIVGAAQAALR